MQEVQMNYKAYDAIKTADTLDINVKNLMGAQHSIIEATNNLEFSRDATQRICAEGTCGGSTA